MSDAKLLARLRSIDKHQQKIANLILGIELSKRRDAKAISDALFEQCWQPAKAEDVGGDFLGEDWVNVEGVYINTRFPPNRRPSA